MRGSRAAFVEATGQDATAVEQELAAITSAPLRTMLAHALVLEGDSERGQNLRRHYLETMAIARASSRHALFEVELVWERLPRLSAAIEKLFAMIVRAGVDPVRALGAESAAAWRARSRTIEELYARTHYGAFMPMLYGNEAALAYAQARGAERGWDAMATIDRYLVAPIIHEVCHFAPERDALMPIHLDECIAGWLAVCVHPESAYPDGEHDDALFASPWLAQVGQAIARAFGIDAVVRAHAGGAPWDALVPEAFVDEAARVGWDDWRTRRSLHLLADTLDPDPWIALARKHATVAADDAFDRAIVLDAVRAMCLETIVLEGAFSTRARVPEGPIVVADGWMTTARRGVDIRPPRYALPAVLAERRVELTVDNLVHIPSVAAAVWG